MDKPTMCLLCPHMVTTWDEAYCEVVVPNEENELSRVGLGMPSWCPLATASWNRRENDEREQQKYI